MVYAPESGSKRTLSNIKKRVKLPKLIESIRAAKRNNHIVKANFIIGFPDEKRLEVYQTLLFVWRLAFMGLDDVDLALFTPYPGSPLFKELLEKNEVGPINDQYFEDLIVLYDFTFAKSFSRHLSSAELLFYRVFGLAIFYSLAYIKKPIRGAKVLLHYFFGRRLIPENLFEQRISDAYARSID